MKLLRGVIICAVLLSVLALVSCGNNPSYYNPDDVPVDYITTALDNAVFPEMGDSIAVENEFVAIDVSGINDGYIMVLIKKEPTTRLKLAIKSGDETYYYNLMYDNGVPDVFTFFAGSGDYKVIVYENISGTSYSFMLGFNVTVSLANEYAPFLLPNQLVSYSADDHAIQYGIGLTYGAQDDLAKVKAIFDYIVNNIDYDYDKAADIIENRISDYLPNPDETLETKKGICFDYAALFAAMLRSNGIPAKLIIGYADPGNVYHSWNMIYIRNVGWMSAEIYFDGQTWQLADSTYAASNNTRDTTYYPTYEY